jgi:uncharacterized protein (UPF0548 family)
MRITLASASAPGAALGWQATKPTTSIGQMVGVRDRYEGEVLRLPGEDPCAAFERIRARLFRYDIFPPAVLTSSISPPGEVAEGALILQRLGLGPVCLEFAVRVVEMWDRHTPNGSDAGFTYVTLQGHPERGTETFRAQLGPDRKLIVTIESWSRPGIVLVHLVRPIARLIQRAVTRAAMRRLTDPGSA